MWRSLFLSTTSPILALAACSSGPAKPDAYCGAGGAAPTGITATGTGFSLTFGPLYASANNDCPDPMAPKGIVALTIQRTQTAADLFTLCIGRPDQLAGGLAFPTQVKLVDLTGSANGCTFLPAPGMAASGTISATGVCDNGTSKAGFALTIDAMVPLQRTCGAAVDTVMSTVSGTVAISGPM